jgi:hypothetical protein
MKIECACGHLIHDGTDDLPHKAHVVPDQLWNGIFEAIDNLLEQRCATALQREAACTKIRSLVGNATRLAWQCSGCGRLYVDDAGYALQSFVPADASVPRDLFRRRERG